MTRRTQQAVLNVRRAVTFTSYTPHFGLITTIPDFTITSGQTGSTEVPYTGYARITVAFAAPTNPVPETSQVATSALGTFGQMTGGAGGHVGYVGEFDAATVGNLMHAEPLPDVGTALTVTAATNATPIAITTSAAHNLATGMFINITGVTGNTAANGRRKLTVTGASTFTLDGSVGNGAYISGGSAQRFGFEIVLNSTPSIPLGLYTQSQT
jgi:hypothetical protein